MYQKTTDRPAYATSPRVTRGVTMIELLVAIAILSVLVVLLVPQIRMVTKERGIREATRTVGAAFADASLRARMEGSAGLAIVRNPNYYRYVDNTGTTYDSVGARVYYSSTTLYQLRAVRPYIGNQSGDGAVFGTTVLGGNTFRTVTIASPFSATLNTAIKRDALAFRFPGRAGKFTVIPNLTTEDTALGILTFVLVPNPDMPLLPDGVPFELHRAPRLDPTSEVRLPKGYHINLNYSGNLDISNADPWDDPFTPEANPFTWTSFTQSLPAGPSTDPNLMPIIITFDETGGVDVILPNASQGAGYFTSEPLAICVTEDRVADSFNLNITGASTAADFLPKSFQNDGTDVLNDSGVHWILVNNLTGAATVAESTPPTIPLNPATVGVDQPLRILQARQLSATRQNATQ